LILRSDEFHEVGIIFSDLITAVSPTYAREIQEKYEFGLGLEGVLRERSDKLIGILNGIDDEQWNPATDPLIRETTLQRNYRQNARTKKALLQRYGLDASHPECHCWR